MLFVSKVLSAGIGLYHLKAMVLMLTVKLPLEINMVSVVALLLVLKVLQ
jgi:hypothetical protein